MKKADLVIGQAYWYQRGTTDFNHAKVTVTNLNPDVHKRFASTSSDPTLVGVNMVHVSDKGEEFREGDRVIRSATIKGDWGTMRADYLRRQIEKDAARRQRDEAILIAKDHFNEVYRPKFRTLTNLIEASCGTHFSSTFGGSEYKPLSGIPEDIVDFLLEALGRALTSE